MARGCTDRPTWVGTDQSSHDRRKQDSVMAISEGQKEEYRVLPIRLASGGKKWRFVDFSHPKSGLSHDPALSGAALGTFLIGGRDPRANGVQVSS